MVCFGARAKYFRPAHIDGLLQNEVADFDDAARHMGSVPSQVC
jgi:hypothetical protein